MPPRKGQKTLEEKIVGAPGRCSPGAPPQVPHLRQDARHYIGFVDGGEVELLARLERHREGTGARLMEVITLAGITWELARTWDGDRRFERRLKNRKNACRLCPICREERSKATCDKPSRRRAA